MTWGQSITRAPSGLIYLAFFILLHISVDRDVIYIENNWKPTIVAKNTDKLKGPFNDSRQHIQRGCRKSSTFASIFLRELKSWGKPLSTAIWLSIRILQIFTFIMYRVTQKVYISMSYLFFYDSLYLIYFKILYTK